MEKDLDGFKSCSPCTRACLESHGYLSNAEQSFGSPSFLKPITDEHLSSSAGFVVRIFILWIHNFHPINLHSHINDEALVHYAV